MEINWEKLPERLHSEALKCLLCNIMRRYAKDPQGAFDGFINCHVYMTEALTTDDNEAFTEDAETLLKSLSKRFDRRLDEASKAEVTAFLETHHEYIRDRTKEVLERATECPDFKLKERS